ncbi:hypothetical protein CFIO01_10702 [Colletotrichum fioriniae PJ7]|uniref:Serine/arginine repetitive matrix protein 1 n=1 Tax=Colletotrichum fioriniae PJ7 TaxID=1445577 RepID=A0A010RNW9_9PEZI|nr:hypothetical protein CFIO01_10702 [Colletotrichum fioriniae PJ7]
MSPEDLPRAAARAVLSVTDVIGLAIETRALRATHGADETELEAPLLPIGRSPAIRDERSDRARSPPRRDNRDRERERDRDRDFDRRDDRYRALPPFAQTTVSLPIRRRSRSPYGRDRGPRDRSPPRRSPAPVSRGNYRPRSRSTSRRGGGGERYVGSSYRRASPPRDSGISSAITSRSASGKSSPHPPPSTRARSRPQSRERGERVERVEREQQREREREPTPLQTGASAASSSSTMTTTIREAPKPAANATANAAVSAASAIAAPQEPAPPAAKTPPRGPAALRAPPTGPAATRNFTAPASSPAVQPPRHPPTPSVPPSRADAVSPTIPPAGPRGYVAPARGGGYSARGGRGSWSGPSPRQALAPTTSPSAIGNGPSSIPTGPRANPSNTTPLSTSSAPKAFNPPTGPSSQHGGPGNVRLTLAQSMLATLPPIIPGGKIDPSLLPTTTGITRDIEPHYKKLKAEEEKARAELDAKQDKLRQSLQMWDKLEMESKAWKTRVDVSEQSLKSLAGEGMGGAAF